jgi:hypothetical protein
MSKVPASTISADWINGTQDELRAVLSGHTDNGVGSMKKLYARFVLWLIRPAIEAERREHVRPHVPMAPPPPPSGWAERSDRS